MFIKLTNATPEFKGTEVLLNTDMVMSVNTGLIERQSADGTTFNETVTFIYCPPHGTWEVTETVDEVLELMNSKKGCCR